MSHFANLRAELNAKEQELKQQQAAAEELAKLTKEFEQKKQALAAKAADFDAQSDEVTTMKNRLELLADLATPLNAAMKAKITSNDFVQQVLEAAIRSGHLNSKEIMQRTVNIAKVVGGRARGDVLTEVLDGLIDDEMGLGASDVVKSALTVALRQGAKPAALLEGVAKTAYDMLGDKAQAAAAPQPIKETPIVNLPKENLKENTAPSGRPQATPEHKNGLRGQADDFKPRSATPNGNQNGNQNGGGWESFARENGVGNVGEQNKASTGARGTGWGTRADWGSIPGWGL